MIRNNIERSLWIELYPPKRYVQVQNPGSCACDFGNRASVDIIKMQVKKRSSYTRVDHKYNKKRPYKKRPYKKGTLLRRDQRENSHVNMEAEIRVMLNNQ